MSTAGTGGDAVTVAGRIRVAAQNVRGPSGSDRMQDDALLTRIGLDATGWLRARRAIARFTMLRRHGCTGLSCTHQDHVGHREERDEAIAMLDPTGGRDTRKDGWGRRQKGGRK